MINMARNEWKHASLNMLIIFAGLVFYTFLFNFIVIHVDLTWLQRGEAYAVYALQNAAGINAAYNPTDITISYAAPAFGMEIIALCTGIGELLFFAFLVLLFQGPSWKTKGRGLALFLPIIFIINIIRLLAIYPLALWLGVDAMWGIHWFIWKYGMFIVLMALFTVWYWFLARKELLIKETSDKKLSGKPVKSRSLHSSHPGQQKPGKHGRNLFD